MNCDATDVPHPDAQPVPCREHRVIEFVGTTRHMHLGDHEGRPWLWVTDEVHA